MDLSQIISWAIDNFIELLQLIVTVIFGILALWIGNRIKKELSFPEKIANIPEFLTKEYINLEFRNPSKEKDENLKSLKDVRNHIKNLQKQKKFVKNNLLNEGTIENAFAYQVSTALERVGVMILSGAIPINIVMVIFGADIVYDWCLCSELINKKMRATQFELTTPKNNTNIKFMRRHAEWLAYASAVYLYRNTKGKKKDQLLSTFRKVEKISIHTFEEQIREREQELRNSEPKLVLKETSKKISAFLFNS